MAWLLAWLMMGSGSPHANLGNLWWRGDSTFRLGSVPPWFSWFWAALCSLTLFLYFWRWLETFALVSPSTFIISSICCGRAESIPSCWTALTNIRCSSGDQLIFFLQLLGTKLKAWCLFSWSCNCFLTTCCHMFWSIWTLTGFVTTSWAPFKTAFIMACWSSLADITRTGMFNLELMTSKRVKTSMSIPTMAVRTISNWSPLLLNISKASVAFAWATTLYRHFLNTVTRIDRETGLPSMAMTSRPSG